jgi:hypothetical protein
MMHKFLKALCLLSILQNNVNAMESCDSFAKNLISAIKNDDLYRNSKALFPHLTSNYDVKGLLRAGDNVNQYDVEQDTTPLIAAAQLENHDESIVRLLLERGAKVNFQHTLSWCPPASQTPLTAALAHRQPAYNIVHLLIANKADVCRPDKFGNTPLMLVGRIKELTASRFVLRQTVYNRIVQKIVHGLTKEQTKRLTIFLGCLKKRGCEKGFRSSFKPLLLWVMKKENKIRAVQEINKIEKPEEKVMVLELARLTLGLITLEELEFEKFLAQNPNIRRCWAPGCSFAYELDELESPALIECPNCGKPVTINQKEVPHTREELVPFAQPESPANNSWSCSIQ